MQNLTKKQTLGCFFNNLGNCYSMVGELDNARIALERAVTITPTLGEAHTNLGNVLKELGQQEEALGAKVITVFPRNNQEKTHPSAKATHRDEFSLYHAERQPKIVCI